MESLKKLRQISEGKYQIAASSRDKRVLEIGCVNHSLEELKKQIELGNWLFGYLVKVAKKAVGIDISPEPIKYLTKKGYDIRLADAQNFDLGEKFDLVVVSAVTDHLLNYDGFMKSCAAHLEKGGELLIFEDNILSIPALIYQRLRKGKSLGMHEDITFKPLPFTFANFANRYGFKVKEIRYLAQRRIVKLVSLFIPAAIRPDELIYDFFICRLVKQ